MLARALAAAGPAQAKLLAMVGRPDLSDADIADIQQAIVDTGALADLEATIARLTDEATAAISAADIVESARDELIALAAFVSQRER